MSFNDFLSKQSIKVIVQTEITDSRVSLPVEVDSKAFYKEFSTDIESNTLTTEKAIYIASMEDTSNMITSRDLLNSKLYFD